jgi:hypothetical protein
MRRGEGTRGSWTGEAEREHVRGGRENEKR